MRRDEFSPALVPRTVHSLAFRMLRRRAARARAVDVPRIQALASVRRSSVCLLRFSAVCPIASIGRPCSRIER